MKMRKNKRDKGITLIALIITIIILLILAGVSISLVVGDNGVLTQSQNAVVKTNNASELETLQLAVSGSYNNHGNLDLELLESNLRKELPTETTTVRDESGNFPVTVIAKHGIYEINSNGNVEKKSGATFSPNSIVFVEGGTNSVVLTVNPIEGATISSVSWGEVTNSSITLETSGNSATVTLGTANCDLATNGTTITATVTTGDGKTHELECPVTYTETTIAGLIITSSNLTLNAGDETGQVTLAGRGALGTLLPLAEEDLSKVGLTASNNTVDSETSYVTVGAAILSGDNATITVTAGNTVTPSGTPVTLTAKWNGTIQTGTGTSITVTVQLPDYLGWYVNKGDAEHPEWAIIYADLLAGKPVNGTSGKLGNSDGIGTPAVASSYKNYSESASTVHPSDDFPASKELTIASGGGDTPRFLAMSLSDYNDSTAYNWSGAYANHVEGTNTWFLPSRNEWLMFGAMLTKVIGSDRYSDHGLRGYYWSSTATNVAWGASFSSGKMDWNSKEWQRWLCAFEYDFLIL